MDDDDFDLDLDPSDFERGNFLWTLLGLLVAAGIVAAWHAC